MEFYRTRLVKSYNLSDTLIVINDFLSKTILIPVFGLCLFTIGCNRGFTLKIDDQDVLAFGSQNSCNFITTTVLSNTLRVSWKTATPVNLVITAGVPTDFDSEILNAAAKWNSSLGRNLLIVRRDNSYANGPGNDGVNAIYWSTEWQTEQAAQQARTAVRWDVSKLKDTDVRINAKNFDFYKTDDQDFNGKIHLESLMIHEFGHVLGLIHIADIASVMQTQLRSATTRNQPGAVDLSSAKCEY